MWVLHCSPKLLACEFSTASPYLKMSRDQVIPGHSRSSEVTWGHLPGLCNLVVNSLYPCFENLILNFQILIFIFLSQNLEGKKIKTDFEFLLSKTKTN